MLQRIVLSLLVALLYCQGFLKAQNNEAFENAIYFFKEEDFQEAVYFFLKLNESDTSNFNVNYFIGHSYLNIPGDEYKALPYLQKAIEGINMKYKKNDINERQAPPHALYYLAYTYKLTNQIDSARSYYLKFLNLPNVGKKYNLSFIEKELKACEQAKYIVDKPIIMNRTILPALINNPSPNNNALVSENENVIVFMTHLKFYQAIFMSVKVNNEWSDPENISPQIGSDGDCKPVFLNSAGNYLLLSRKISKSNYDIYESSLTDHVWSKMAPLNDNINTRNAESHASMTKDGSLLYFVSDRSGTFGQKDIWVSKRNADNNWGRPVNAGSKINTSENEETPFITGDGKVLFFASEGHMNMGGFDIFYSKQNSDNNWEPPVNIGYPINTTGNDLFYFPIANGTIAYMSQVLPNSFGKEDIFKIENTSLKYELHRYTGRSDNEMIHFDIIDMNTNDTIMFRYDKIFQNITPVKVPSHIKIQIKQ